MEPTRQQLLSFLKHLEVADVDRAANALNACGVECPSTLVDVDADDREDVVAKLKSFEVSIGDRTKVKRAQRADVETWRRSATDELSAASLAVAIPSAVPPPKKFVVKATQALMTTEELWIEGIRPDEVEAVEDAAHRTRSELREKASLIQLQRANLVAAVRCNDDALKELDENQKAMAAKIDAELSTAQTEAEVKLDLMRAELAISVHSRKQALLNGSSAAFAERRRLLEEQKERMSAAEAQHAKAEEAIAAAMGKDDEAVLGAKSQVATLSVPYEYSLELAAGTNVLEEFHDVDMGLQLTTNVGAAYVNTQRFFAEWGTGLPDPPSFLSGGLFGSVSLSVLISFNAGKEISPVKPSAAPPSGEKLTAIGLPQGLHLDPSSWIISGTLQQRSAGRHRVALTVENVVGKKEVALDLVCIDASEGFFGGGGLFGSGASSSGLFGSSSGGSLFGGGASSSAPTSGLFGGGSCAVSNASPFGVGTSGPNPFAVGASGPSTFAVGASGPSPFFGVASGGGIFGAGGPSSAATKSLFVGVSGAASSGGRTKRKSDRSVSRGGLFGGA